MFVLFLFLFLIPQCSTKQHVVCSMMLCLFLQSQVLMVHRTGSQYSKIISQQAADEVKFLSILKNGYLCEVSNKLHNLDSNLVCMGSKVRNLKKINQKTGLWKFDYPPENVKKSIHFSPRATKHFTNFCTPDLNHNWYK